MKIFPLENFPLYGTWKHSKIELASCEIVLSRGLKSCLNSSYSSKQVIKTVSK